MHRDMTLMVIILMGFVLVIFSLSVLFGPWVFLAFGVLALFIITFEFRAHQIEKYQEDIIVDNKPVKPKRNRRTDWSEYESEV